MPSEKSFLDLFSSEDFKGNLKSTIESYATPAILAALGTGALGVSLASRNKILHETPNKRRKRLLRAALTPTAMTLAAAGSLGLAHALTNTDVENAINNVNKQTPIQKVFDEGKAIGKDVLDFVMPNSREAFTLGTVGFGSGLAAHKLYDGLPIFDKKSKLKLNKKALIKALIYGGIGQLTGDAIDSTGIEFR
jgi:hypothetical protein